MARFEVITNFGHSAQQHFSWLLLYLGYIGSSCRVFGIEKWKCSYIIWCFLVLVPNPLLHLLSFTCSLLFIWSGLFLKTHFDITKCFMLSQSSDVYWSQCRGFVYIFVATCVAGKFKRYNFLKKYRGKIRSIKKIWFCSPHVLGHEGAIVKLV